MSNYFLSYFCGFFFVCDFYVCRVFLWDDEEFIFCVGMGMSYRFE